jgi:hypothetical protein
VTDDEHSTLTRLSEALREAPHGSRGLVHRVMLSFARAGYIYESLIAVGRFEPSSGAVVWEDISGPTTWGLPCPRVTDSPESIGDALPPEAIAAGLADLAVEQGRGEEVPDLGKRSAWE